MPATRPPRCRGVTLLELMMTLAISAVLLGLAAPSFNGMYLDSQRAVAVNALIHAIFLARTTAIVRNHVVSICRSADGETCSNQLENWQQGWIVFVNHDRDDPPVRDPGEPLLAVQAPWAGGTITSNRLAYSFRSFQHRVVNGTVVFCDRRGSAHARAIIINNAGRPRVSKRDSSNRPLRCPDG
jgi:type IV fimbrial biogenesis protein FimT